MLFLVVNITDVFDVKQSSINQREYHYPFSQISDSLVAFMNKIIKMFLFIQKQWLYTMLCWVEAKLYRFFFIVCLYLYCRWWFNYQKGLYPINRFNPPHLCACPKLGPEFSTLYCMVFFYSFVWGGWYSLCVVVNIGEIFYHLFILM
jgi:hypothetical protein